MGSPKSIAFRRAITLFPAPAVTVETPEGRWKPSGFCAASYEPPIVALTFADSTPLPGQPFTVSTEAAILHCSERETRSVGDHTMLLATVERVEIRGGQPLVNWRRASFRLRLDYPFLESRGALETFVTAWRIGALAKADWTHAAHVATTAYHAFDANEEEVFDVMKRGILHFNSCVGVINGLDSGYHETLTRFWSQIITRTVKAASLESRFDAARYAIGIFGEDRDLPSLFYSFDVPRNQQARREWIEPDSRPLPEWCGAWGGSCAG